MRYLFIIEKAPQNYCGYFPDVPGCVAATKTVEKLLMMAAEALACHFEDEPKLPRARSLAWHLDKKDLKLLPTDMVAWVAYTPEETLATA